MRSSNGSSLVQNPGPTQLTHEIANASLGRIGLTREGMPLAQVACGFLRRTLSPFSEAATNPSLLSYKAVFREF
jgi:hypothetical protein